MKQFESFRLDTANECLWRDDEQIALPPKPFALLRYLVDHPGRLITHDELLDAVWPQTYVQPQVLRTYVLELRKLLGDAAGQPRFIQTLPRRGYRFVASVTDRDGFPAAAPGASASAAVPLATPNLAGRESELAHLQAQLASLAKGQRRVVFVSGEAGIGKTSLVDAFCRHVIASRQASVARGQCVEGFSAADEYYPVMEALGHLCASSEGETACRALTKIAPAWLPAPGQQPSAASPRMSGDLCAALEDISARKPLVLVFEDLHWADDATLKLISALARRRAPAGLMILATCGHREGTHPCRRLKQDLLVRQLCTEITLTPLSRTAVEQMLSRKLEQDELPPGLAAFVHQHSEGNPLFAIAIVEHLIAEGFLVHNGEWQLRGSLEDSEARVPAGLAQMIDLEIQNLTPEEQHILEAASLMGIAFPVWAVAAALERDPASTEEACDELARRLYFVERAGQDELPDGTESRFYVFGHGLYREVLYRRQSMTRRAAGHLRIAERLSELFAGRQASVARELAMHYEAAADWNGAANALRAAAAHALHREAFAEAAELLERALRLTGKLSESKRAPLRQQIQNELQAARARL